MTRCARGRRVFFIEEPEFGASSARLRLEWSDPVTVVVPELPANLAADAVRRTLRLLIDELIRTEDVSEYLLWYYSPMPLDFTSHLAPAGIVYDCMDELSGFKGAPALIKQYEAELLKRADLVLTGGMSLYRAKRHQHANIHPFPSSVDVPHFARARRIRREPSDQAAIPHPRLGFFGVIDERMDLALIDGVAAARPDWQLVMLGPVVKIDRAVLPQRPNIHYLGSKSYDELPAYIAGWDVALLPFARNDATKFISPTKTPEYLAAGKPVVSTSIRDVIEPYGENGLVRIADEVPAFVSACVAAMEEDAGARIAQADAFLRHTSWDETWRRIEALVNEVAPLPAARDIHAGVSAAAAVSIAPGSGVYSGGMDV